MQTDELKKTFALPDFSVDNVGGIEVMSSSNGDWSGGEVGW